MTGIQDEDAILQEFHFGEGFTFAVAFDQPGQHIDVRIARRRAPRRHKTLEIVEKLDHRLIPAGQWSQGFVPVRIWQATYIKNEVRVDGHAKLEAERSKQN